MGFFLCPFYRSLWNKKKEHTMKTITKALITIQKGDVHLELIPMNYFIPLNRYIDEAGHYALELKETKKSRYLLTVLKEEVEKPKSKFLISKYTEDNIIVDLSIDDQDDLLALAYQETGITPSVQ
jgi:hypothetical protein